MERCYFCQRPAERRLWLRRWRVREGRRLRAEIRDVRLALCREHLRGGILRGGVLRKGPWAYG